MEYVYYAKIEADPDGGYIVTFPDVPEAITAGVDRKEALEHAEQALGLALRSYFMRDLPLPVSNYYEGLHKVNLDAWNTLKLAVVQAFREANITKVELAHRLGKQETEARRILDPNYPTKLQTLEAVLAVLGKKLVVMVKDAA